MTAAAAAEYQHLLQRAAGGVALFHPSPDAAVGDCGYVDGGRFHRLFNVFDPPDGLPGLPPPARVRTAAPNGGVLRSARTSFFGAHGGFPVATHAPLDVEFDLDHRQPDTAFLALAGGAREEDELADMRALQDYLVNNEALILRTWRRVGFLSTNSTRDSEPVSLVILHGTARAAGWFGGVVHCAAIDARQPAHEDFADFESAGIGGTVRFNARRGDPVVMLHDAAKQHVTNTALTWAFTHGPAPGARAQSHCVAVRPVVIRRRERVGDAARTVTSAMHTSTMHARPRDDVLRRVRLSIHDLRSKARELLIPSHRRNPSSASILPTAAHTPESSAESNGYFEHPEPETACTSMTDAETLSGPSILHDILDAILDSHPEIALAVGDWKVIDRYVETHDELPEPDCCKSLDIVQTGHHGCVAYLLDVAPPVHHTHSMHFDSFVTPPGELDALHATLMRPHMDRLRRSILKLEAQHFQLTEAHEYL